MQYFLQSDGENKDGRQMIIPVENGSCSPDLEKREAGSFRNLTSLCIPYMLARGGSTIRCEEMDWGLDMPGQELYILPFLNGVRSNRSSLH